jgi:hypothetical protein
MPRPKVVAMGAPKWSWIDGLFPTMEALIRLGGREPYGT